MINQRNISARFTVANILRWVLAILACLLFLFSLIFPFYYAYFSIQHGIYSQGGGTTYYWSYKIDVKQYVYGVLHRYEDWFLGYWFHPNRTIVTDGIPWIPMSMFIAQALTLVFGVVSVIFNRRILSIMPFLLSLTVMVLMTYAIEFTRSAHALPLPPFALGEYQLGYYLMFPSVVLFLSAFTLAEVKRIKKPQTAEKVPSCPICKTELRNIERTIDGYDYECPNCHRKFELLRMETRPDRYVA